MKGQGNVVQIISTWTDDRIAQLTKLFGEGYSCAQIAAELGDATRNAVIGKVNRLGLSREKQIRVKVDAPRAPREHKARIRIARSNGNSNSQRVFIASETEQYRLRCVEIEPRHLTLMDLEKDDCTYPYGDGPFTYCGHPKREGSSYCVPHHHLCWVKPQSNKPKARIYHGTDFARGAA